jgi:hypothetical protein
MEKYASNVIEKCIDITDNESKILNMFIVTILNQKSVLNLMKSIYGNYVIQKALKISSGDYKKMLLEAVSKSIDRLGEKKIIEKWKNIVRNALNKNETFNDNGNNNNNNSNYINNNSQNEIYDEVDIKQKFNKLKLNENKKHDNTYYNNNNRNAKVNYYNSDNANYINEKNNNNNVNYDNNYNYSSYEDDYYNDYSMNNTYDNIDSFNCDSYSNNNYNKNYYHNNFRNKKGKGSKVFYKLLDSFN